MDVAGGPRLPFVWQAQHLVNCGRLSAQSRQEDRARGRCWAAAAFCVAGAVLGEPGLQIISAQTRTG